MHELTPSFRPPISAPQQLADALGDVAEILHVTATAGSTTEVHVDMDQLVGFYNALAELRVLLRESMALVTVDGVLVHLTNAGGAVPGVQEVWTAVGETTGILSGSPSLHGNMQAFDALITSHMAAIAENVKSYSAQDVNTVVAFQAAAQS